MTIAPCTQSCQNAGRDVDHEDHEDEGSDSEPYEKTPARSSSKKSGSKSKTSNTSRNSQLSSPIKKSRPRASTSATKRSAAQPEPEDEDEEMPLVAQSLVDCYERLLAEGPRSKSEPSLLLSMSLDKWVQAYNEEPVSAILELLNFFIHASGLPDSCLDLANAEAARAAPCADCSRARSAAAHNAHGPQSASPTLRSRRALHPPFL